MNEYVYILWLVFFPSPIPNHTLITKNSYLFLQLVLAVVNDNGVVMAVETMNQRLDGRLVQVANVGGGLAGLLIEEHQLRVDGAEGVNHDLALDGLDGINHHGHSTLVQLLKTL